MQWYQQACQQPSQHSRELAEQRQSQLTKPTGSLAELEQVAIHLAALQNTSHPQLDRPWICIYAADHGVMAEKISAYPQIVTRQMLHNFMTGGACISVIAREYDAQLDVIDCGTVGEPYHVDGVLQVPVSAGTANFVETSAMTLEQCLAALEIGKSNVETAYAEKASIYIAGEMGIGNTCSASTLACLILDMEAKTLTGVGTGLNEAQLQHKVQVIERAIALHSPKLKDQGIDILCAVGGFEIAAMVGAYIRCAQIGLPILVDGFISTAAALVACQINPQVRDWMLFGHQSAERGHVLLLEKLKANPLLKLNMRLGEGSGAGAALGLIRLACRLHNEMATFAEAAVIGDKLKG
ncbi:nicotinate-nucleotide--dimethylbenzimidazole phosphoribosyltransferase [Acinetobacter rudis]|uniref:Nicotinate-nucleotide--dimethylbenzimidazole phosphoribosyltransferase n=1 Tax=Acinetobacter rudis TaxID=632955 RepID=A0AAW8J8Q7_9GAMM|nr:nicotinate-nucleotide--dimethylbenzimidazole phosphoribosyltransferase [Acinetobacter rudis]MDQ8935561.1 nicotinate-nucleotide--dimethylbenzimidazole phosphoribosyltransferase [Acinetobacter rudis]MDQ9017824.1 nicotinate-nucleotide--dimethylbenzimidazole phosphoribosyltransferase [Acinetobacter rudis]